MVCRPLLEGELEIQEIAETLWKAPMAILSSNDGDSDGEPPVFKYANEVGMTSWMRQCLHPSRITVVNSRSSASKHQHEACCWKVQQM